MTFELLEERAMLATWSGSIPDGTVWGATPDEVEVIAANVLIPEGATLTIEPGAVVKFESGTRMEVDGNVDSLGTITDPIFLTSIKDDSVGGDTNGDGSATAPTPGDWQQLRLLSGDTANVDLTHTTIRYAGQSNSSAVWIQSGSLALSNTQIIDAAASGVTTNTTANSNITLNDLTITNAGGHGVAVNSPLATVNTLNLTIQDVSATHILSVNAANWNSTNTNLSGTGVKAIKFEGGTIADTRSWDDNPVYYLSGTVNVNAGASLTIPAGKVVKSDISGELGVNGALIVAGTSTNHVTFTSIKDDSVGGDTNNDGNATTPAAGDWRRFVLNDNSADVQANYLDFRYAGRSGLFSIWVSRGSLTLQNTTIANVTSTAIATSTSSNQNINLNDVSIMNTGGQGIRIDSTTATVNSTNLNITDVSGTHISTANAGLWNSANTNLSGTGIGAIRFDGGTITDVRAWDDLPIYYLSGTVNVSAGASLTIPAGKVIKADSEGELGVNGALIINGTSTNHVTFTSIKDDSVGGDTNADGNATVAAAGDWRRIVLNSNSALLQADFMDFRYAGRSGLTALWVSRGGLTLRDVEITDLAAAGVGVSASSNQNITLNDVFIRNTGGYGFRNDSTIATVTSTNLRIQDVLNTHIVTANAGRWNSTNTMLSGTGVKVIRFDGGTITDARSWDENLIYYLSGIVSVSAGASLTIPAGKVIKADKTGELSVAGTLQALGTPEAMITFTSIHDDTVDGDTNNNGDSTSPAAGDWARILISGNTASANLDHVNLNYGGYRFGPPLHVINEATLSLSNSTIFESERNGLGISGNAVLNNNHVRNIAHYGINIAGSASVTMSDTLIENAAYGAYQMDQAANVTATGTVATGSGRDNAIVVTGSSIQHHATWQEDLTYFVDLQLAINTNGRLDIAPGTVVKLKVSAFTEVINIGIFQALGTAAEPIVITSARDDSIGGDTNGDGNATLPAAGDYFRFRNSGSGFGGTASMSHVQLRYGGSRGPAVLAVGDFSFTQGEITDSASGGIEVSSVSSFSLAGTTIRRVAGAGVSAGNADRNTPLELTDLRIEDTSGVAIALHAASDFNLTGSSFMNTAADGAVTVAGSGINNSRSWAGGLTYRIDGSVSVGGSGELNIAEGAVLKFGQYQGLINDGKVTAVGTPENPVVFTSIHDDFGGDTNQNADATVPAAGDWFTVWHRDGFKTTNNSAHTDLQHTEIRYAGIENGNAPTPSILIDGGTVHLSNTHIRDGVDAGLRMRWSNVSNVILDSVVIQNVAAEALSLGNLGGGGTITMNDILLQNVGGDALIIGPNNLEYSLTNVTLENVHGLNGTRVLAGDVNRDLTLGYLPLVLLERGLQVMASASLSILPGTTVKVDDSAANTAIVGHGPVFAEGTAIAPILFTSLSDDTVLGDTNGDGFATTANAGDWSSIDLRNGLSRLAHVEIRNAGEAGPGLWVRADSTLSDLTIHDIAGSAINTTTGRFQLNNALLYNYQNAGINLLNGTTEITLISNTIHGGQAPLRMQTGLMGTIVNNNLTGGSIAGIDIPNGTSPVLLSTRHNNLFNADAVNGNIHDPGAVLTLTDGSGDISQDPAYVDPGNGIFELAAGSPSIDAADGNASPAFDLYDRLRHNDTSVPNTGVGLVPYTDIGAVERQHSGTGVDLVPVQLSVSVSTASLELNDTIQFDYAVQNKGSQNASEVADQWTDQFVLRSSPGQRDSQDFVIGDQNQAQEIAAGSTVLFTRTLPVPANLVSGTYQAGVLIDQAHDVAESLPTGDQNNLLFSSQLLNYQAPQLTIGTPLAGDWSIDPLDQVFEFLIPANSTVRFDWATDAHAVEAFFGFGFRPDRLRFDRSLSPDSGPLFLTNPLTIPLTGTVRLLLGSRPSAVASYTLSSNLLVNSLRGINVTEAGNTGPFTLLVEGGPFVGNTTFSLIGPDQVFPAVRTKEFSEGDIAAATFDLTGATTGSYDVQAVFPGGALATLDGALTVVAGGGGEFKVELLGPDFVRAGQETKYTLKWQNTGNQDMPVELIGLDLPEEIHVATVPNGKERENDFFLFGFSPGTTDYGSLPAGGIGRMDLWLTAPAGLPEISAEIRHLPTPDPFFQGLPVQAGDVILGLGPPSNTGRWIDMAAGVAADLGSTWDEAFDSFTDDPIIDFASEAIDDIATSFEGVEDAIEAGASQITSQLADKMAENYPAPMPGAEGDGVHQDFVIIVAIEDYSNWLEQIGVKVNDLPGTTEDMENLLEFYREELNIGADQITVLHDKPGESDDDMTFEKIKQAWIDTVAKADADDKIKFHYSGHGNPGDGAMVMNGDDTVTADELKDMMDDDPMPGETYTVFDSCHSGALGQDLSDVPGLRWESACAPNETAADGETYTQQWLDAHQDQDNDQDGDGKVVISEAFDKAAADYTVAHPKKPKHPQTGGDEDVDQELHDDLGDTARNRSILDSLAELLNGAQKAIRKIFNLFAQDPNEKVGPVGVGAENYVPHKDVQNYTVYFENDPEVANAPAQVVTITDQLSTNLDWTTFQFGEVSFGTHTVQLRGTPTRAGAQVFAQETGVRVDIQAEFDAQAGVATWTFSTLDLRTSLPTQDPLAGFLPPNHTKPEGEGHVAYSIAPSGSVTSNDAITNSASIVFDVNDAIITNEHIVTFDFDAPQSSVDPLPTTSPHEFTVGWGGSDVGSGIGFYDIFVSVDNGPFSLWLSETTDTQAVYQGEIDRRYAFYSVAVDNVGHRETAPNTPDTETVVRTAPPNVTQVLVGSSNWSTDFKNNVLAATNGFFPIPSGTDQLNSIPWTINQIRVKFSEDVTVLQDHLAITGVNNSQYAVQDFTYDNVEHEATWTVASINADKIFVNVSDSILSVASGLALDGEFINGASQTTSGDGSAGGHFHFRLNVLTGDADGNGINSLNDLQLLASNWQQTTNSLNMFVDFDGSNSLSLNDLQLLATNWQGSLPSADPSIFEFPEAAIVHQRIFAERRERHLDRIMVFDEVEEDENDDWFDAQKRRKKIQQTWRL